MLREIDITPVTTTVAKKQLLEVTFRKVDNAVLCLATYRVPAVEGGTVLLTVRRPISEVLTPAQASALLDKVVA